jgi:isopentenyl-diphosphate delta-isomerase
LADGIASRKDDHIRINVHEQVQARGIDAGLDAYHFIHNALPELDLDEVDTSTSLFGRPLKAPLLISCMTGGSADAGRINCALAEVAQACGLAMGLGSGRILLSHPEVLPTFDVRRLAPDVPLIANLGAVQLNYSVTTDDCLRLVDLLSADALALHLNPIQEALQPGGNTQFRGLLVKLERLCRDLDSPVIVKEVGWGLAADVVRSLLDVGVAGVDVAGAGGTSWSEVERHRIQDPVGTRIAGAFAGWGIPTAEAVVAARAIAPDSLLIGSGGVAHGLDVAKIIALGADLAGIAGPFLRAAAVNSDAALDLAREVIGVLRIAMFGVGARTVSELRGNERIRRLS